MSQTRTTKSRSGEAPPASPATPDPSTRYLNAYLDCAHAAARAQLTLQRRASQVYAEFHEVVSDLQREMQDRGVEAFQKYAEDLGAAVSGGDAYEKCRAAYDNYVDAARQLTATQADTERSAAEAYNQYVTAIYDQRDDAEIRERAEAAQNSHLLSVRSRYGGNEMRQRAVEAEQQFAQLFQEAQTQSQQQAAEAVQKYREALQSAATQADVQGRYQGALQSCRDQLRALQERAGAAVLDTHLKSLNDLKAAWEKVGSADA